MTADFTIKQYDTLPAISAILKVGGDVISDLGSASGVKLVLAHSTEPETFFFAKDAVIVNATTGQVMYQWVAGDTDVSGDFVASWHITYSNGDTRTIPTSGFFNVRIEAALVDEPTVVPPTDPDTTPPIGTGFQYVQNGEWQGTAIEVDLANAAHVTGILPTTHGGTGLAVLGTPGQVLGVNGTGDALIWLTPASGGGGGTGAVIFNGSATIGGKVFENIVSDVSNKAAIDNTKGGIVNFGHDDGSVNALGVTGHFATCVGGLMPSITGMYSGGGGYRPNAQAFGAWAFGFSVFADGAGSFAAGKGSVASYLIYGINMGDLTFTPTGANTGTITRTTGSWITDGAFVGAYVESFTTSNKNWVDVDGIPNATVTAITATTLTISVPSTNVVSETITNASNSALRFTTQYGTTFGRQCQARGQGAFSAGVLNILDVQASYAVAFGLNNNIGPLAKYGFAHGTSNEIQNIGAYGIGVLNNITGQYGGALGYQNTISSDGAAFAAGLGNTCSTGTAPIAIGVNNVSAGNWSLAAGYTNQARGEGSVSLGRQNVCSAAADFGGTIGYANSVQARSGMAMGESCTVTAKMGRATGYGSTSPRYGQVAHAASASAAKGQVNLYLLAGTSAAGASVNLMDNDGNEFILENGKAYDITIDVMWGRTDAAGAVRASRHEVLAHTTGGNLVIDDDTEIRNKRGGVVTTTISAPSGLTMRIAATGDAATTMGITATVSWTERPAFA